MTSQIGRVRVLVIGDIMLDIYLHGAATRISPEAPVPVVRIEAEEIRLGGCGNVAINAASLGASASIVAIQGDDQYGRQINELLIKKSIKNQLVVSSGCPTITKTRIVSKNHQLLRIDNEKPFLECDAVQLYSGFIRELPAADVVILSDYAKGSLRCAHKIIQKCNEYKKPVLVDPKGRDFTRYSGASLITPNISEFEDVVGACQNDEQIEEKAFALMKQCYLGAILVTKGERGMTLIREGFPALNLTASAREVCDVTGAGDTVIATAAVFLGAGCSLDQAVRVANRAAGIVVERFGTSSVGRSELVNNLSCSQDVELLDIFASRGVDIE